MFGSIDIKIRPLKLAFLVDPKNAQQVREAICLCSSIWGGFYFPIIPLYKRTPANWQEKPLKSPKYKDVILGYLEAYDPDILVQVSKEVPSFLTGTGLQIIKSNEIWEGFERRGNTAPQYGIGIFEILTKIFDEFFRYKAKYPIKLIFPKIPKKLSMFWAGFFGEIPCSLMPFLEKNFFKALEIKSMDFRLENLKELLAGDVFFPGILSLDGLRNFKRSGFSIGREAIVFFMDATKVQDIIDYWNLRALGKQVIPVPKQLQNDPHLLEFVIGFINSHNRPSKYNTQIYDFATIIKARNCNKNEMDEYVSTIKLNIKRSPSLKPFNPILSCQYMYPRIWDNRARDKDGAVSDDFYGDENTIEIPEMHDLKVNFHPLFPKFADSHSYNVEHRCANEINFRFYGEKEFLAEVFPKATGENLIRTISGATSFRNWRVGRNGLVRFVKNDYIEHWNIPQSERIVFAWLADQGWSPKLSPPGLLAKQIYRMVDGNLNWLANEKLIKFLNDMSGDLKDEKQKTKNKKTKKNNKQIIIQERDKEIGYVKSCIKKMANWDLYEHLISIGVFKIGLKVQCPNCTRKPWFPLNEIKEIFTCPKCLNTFSAVGNIDKRNWSYKTAGPFSFHNYADGAYTVLLAINFLSELRMNLQTSPVLSFIAESKDHRKMEADFAMFWKQSAFGEEMPGLLFAECKTYGEFKIKDYNRMRLIAKNFSGAVLAFCTLNKSLTKKEIKSISSIAKAGRKYWKEEYPRNPILILTGTELFSKWGPPYCWEDAGIKKKFENARGLLDLCDATQQIYLNLKSWETERIERFDKMQLEWFRKQNKQ